MELEHAKQRFRTLKRKLRNYADTLFPVANRGLLLEVSKSAPTLADMMGLDDSCVIGCFGIAEPAAILEFRQSVARVLLRNSFPLLSVFGKSQSAEGLRITYFDIWNFFKFMNVSTFKFEAGRLEPFLNNYVREKIRSPFFSQYFYQQIPAQPTHAATRRASVLKPRSSTVGPATVATGEAVYETYLKYYQHQFEIRDFVQILLELVFGVYNREIQGESHALKAVGVNKDESHSPAKVGAYIANICTFLERFLQTCGLGHSRLGSRHPFLYLLLKANR